MDDCIAVADTGGQTVVASSSQIYNELARTRPDLLEELKKPWVFYQSQDYDTDGTPLITNAVDDKLVFQFSRLPITGFRSDTRNQSIPPPSAGRLEAMSLIEDLAWKNGLALPCQPGDVAFINNLCMLHARTSFDLDGDGNALLSSRHLVKLMLRDPGLAWELPKSLKWLPERIYGQNRTDGTRTEEWQLSVEIGDSLPDGHIWAGTGNYANG
ncbi:hypothetical protein E8E12_009804 [Didymella heteroderae]|uniref:TauD/TfdA-like domain-containing protein n=1 Tax=Didymella heteroderae TaxID=1769908 RepID=A0A9P4X0G8_9PLEO|nr:hypothetical protein E8E12_009804 [Didymella heteroderae]